MGNKWKFEVGQAVTLELSGETGKVDGRAEYGNGSPNGYLVHYKTADGRQVREWWEEEDLKATE